MSANRFGAGDLPPDSTVASAQLLVTVVPPPVRLQLAFDPPELTVAVGGVRTATLRLLGEVPAGAEARLTLSSADTGVIVGLPEGTPGAFDAATMSREVKVEGLAVGSARLTAAVSNRFGQLIGFPPNSSVAPAELLVTVVPALPTTVALQLAFDPTSLTVTVDATATAVLSLSDELPEGVALTVALSAADATARVRPESVIFTAQTRSHDVTVTGVAAINTTLTMVAVTAIVSEDALDDSGLPDGSEVASARLPVTVVPLPVHLALAFDSSTLTVVEGAEASAMLRLPGVPAGAIVPVRVSVAGEAARLISSAKPFFSSFDTRRRVTLEGVSAGSATLTAIADDALATLPPGSTVVPAELAVTVVVHLVLEFELSTLTVVAGAEASAILNISDVPAGFVVPVEVSVAGGAMLTSNTVFGFHKFGNRDFFSAILNIEGVTAGSATLTAAMPEVCPQEILDMTNRPDSFLFGLTCGLPPGSTVVPAELPVTVVLAPIHFRWGFEPASLTVEVGERGEATFRLLSDVPIDAAFDLGDITFAFTASSADESTVQVLITTLAFPGDRPSTISVRGVAEGSATVTAMSAGLGGEPPGSTVTPAELLVTVIPAPVRLALAFEPSTLTVAVGSEATVALNLPGVPEDVEVFVVLQVPDETTVRVVSLDSRIGEGLQFQDDVDKQFVTVEGVAAGSATLKAIVGADALAASRLPAGSTVTSAQLAVTVVPAPVHLALAFEPSTLTVAVGSSEMLQLLLRDSHLVPEGVDIPVSLSVDGRVAGFNRSGLTSRSFFFRGSNVNIRTNVHGLAVGNTTLTAIADVVGATGLPPDSTVEPAALPVTVVPPPVELVLEFDRSTLTVVAGAEAGATLRLPGVPAGATVWVDLRVLDGETARLVSSERIGFERGIATDHNLVTVLGVDAGNTLLTALADVPGSSGLPPDSTVEPAALAVTVVAPPVDLALAFDRSTLTLVAGSEETLVLRLPGVPMNFSVAVELSVASTATARVIPEGTVFTAVTQSRNVTVAGVAAGNTTLTAVFADTSPFGIRSSLPPNSTVASAELAVTVVAAPVHLQFVFEPPALTVAVGARRTAQLRLVGDVPADAQVEVIVRVVDELGMTDETTAQVVTPQMLIFTAQARSYDVTVLGVVVGNASLLTTHGNISGIPADSFVGDAELAVTVVRPVSAAILQLAFDPISLEVEAGATATAVLSLPGVPEGTDVAVTLSAADEATLMPESVIFTADTTSRDVTVTGVAAGSVMVTAIATDISNLPPGSSVTNAELAVTVVLPTVDLQLAFDPTSLTVATGATAAAELSLPGVPDGTSVLVRLLVTDETTAARVLTAQVVFDAQTPSREVRVEGMAEGSVTVTAEPTPGGLSADSMVRSAQLQVTVVPAPVHLALAFDPTSLTVVEGAEASARLNLLDVPLPEGFVVPVRVSVAGEAVRLISPAMVLFSSLDSNGPLVTIEGVATGSATLTAAMPEVCPQEILDRINRLDSFLFGLVCGLPPDSTVALAELVVTVVPPPVRLQLVFDPSTLTVVVGSSERVVVLRLLGEVPLNASILVDLDVPDETVVKPSATRVALSGEGFAAGGDSFPIRVEGVAAGNTTLTAVAVGTLGLPPDSTVESAELPVTVVPPPVHLRLAFDPTSLTVTAGATEMAVLSLLNVPEGADVTVVLLTADAALVQVTPIAAVFDAETTSYAVTLTAVAARSATLTAAVEVVASELSLDDLPPDSTVAPARLFLMVLPPPIALQLAFDPTSLTLEYAVAESLLLSLLGDVPEGAAVTVVLSESNTAIASMLPESLVFTAEATSHRVEVTAGFVAGSATLTARADTLVGSNLPPDSSVEFAELPVTVVPVTVNLQLAFDPSALTVAVGSEQQLTLSYSGLVPAGAVNAEIEVALSVADAATAQVMPESVVLDARFGRSRTVRVEGMTVGSATLTAVATSLEGISEESVVMSAELPVTVVPAPVRLRLAFESTTLTVVAGAMETAVLSLLGDVPEDVEVTVRVSSADEATVQVISESVVFTSAATSPVVTATVTLRGVAAGNTTVFADLSSALDDLPPDSSVLPAELAVTVVPAPVHLQLAFDPPTLEVVTGTMATAVLSLSGDVPEDTTVTVVLSESNTAIASVLPESVVFTALAMSPVVTATVTITGVAVGSVVVTAADVSGATDLPPNSSVLPAELAVTVVLPPVELQLAFDPSTLRVAVGSDATVTLSLPGVPAGAAVTVGVGSFNTRLASASVGMEGTVVFDAATVRHEVTVTGVSEGRVTVEAASQRFTGLSEDSIVEPARLPVTVVPAPVMLQLAFDSLTLTVTADSEETATLSLPDVPAGAMVTVALSAASTATAQVAPESVMVTFTADTPSHDVTIEGVAEGSATLTAVADVSSMDNCIPGLSAISCGLPPDSTVAPAELAVTVMPAPVHLQLAFEPPALTVAAAVQRTAQLRLVGDVPAGAAVTVELGTMNVAAPAQVAPESVMVTFTAQTRSRGVTVLGVAEGSATLTAVVDAEALAASGLPPDSTVASAELAVTVVTVPPVTLQLAFDPMMLEVVTGAAATAVLSLSGVPEGTEVAVTLGAADATTARVVVTPRSVLFTAATVRHEVTVTGVSAGSATVMAATDDLTGLPAGSSVAPAELAVTVVLPTVHLQLAFEPLSLTVAAGSTATAVLSLSAEVPEGAEVRIGFDQEPALDRVGLDPAFVLFDAATTSREVTVTGMDVGNEAVTVLVTAGLVSFDGLSTVSTVQLDQLEVTVVPAPVHLQLAFEPPTLTVTDDGQSVVSLLLPDVPVGFVVPVRVSVAGEAVRLTSSEISEFFSLGNVERVTIEGVTAGNATLTAIAVEDCRPDLPPALRCGLPADSTVALAELAVTVVPAPVRLQLAFDPTSLTVTAGATATATLSLLGVPEGAGVAVELSVADATTARVVTPRSVTFTAAATSRDVTVLGVAAGVAALTASADDLTGFGLPPNSNVASAELAVTVVPAPVRLRLAFDPTSLTVTAGDAAAMATLSLLGNVPIDAALRVELSAADETTLQLMPEGVVKFTGNVLSYGVTVLGVTAGSAAVTAELVTIEASGLPEGSTVTSAELAVTVVPAPVHLQLAFDPTTLAVDLGTDEGVTLSLPGVPAGAEVTVTISTSNANRVQVSARQRSVVFTAAMPSHEVMVTGAGVGSATLSADVDVDALADFGLPPDSTVAHAELAVTVVPRVNLVLAFDPATLTVAVGATATAVLSLPGVPEDAEVTVTVSVADETTARVLTPESVTFTAETPNRDVTVEGVAEGSATLTAKRRSFIGLSGGSTVTPADLAVTVVPPPVHLQLAFDPSTLTVVVGDRKTVRLRLLGEVPKDAAFDLGDITFSVAFRSADGGIARVLIESYVVPGDRFDVDDVTIEGVATGSVTITAVSLVTVPHPGSPGLPPGSSVATAELEVTVVPPPVDLALAFDPSTLAVTAGSSETAVLSLLDVPEGAMVAVTLSVPDATTARVVTPESVVFTAQTQSHDVTVEGVAAGNTTLTASVDENALAGFGLPPNSTVALAKLALTVVPAPVHLQLVFEPPALTVAVSALRTAQLRLVGDVPAGAAVPVELSESNTAIVQVVPESVTFTAQTRNRGLSIVGEAAGSVTLTAVVSAEALADSDLPEGSTVTSAELAVTVVAAPLDPIELQLAFDPTLLEVVAGATATAVLSFAGELPEGIEVPVTLSAADEATVQLVPPESVVFDAQTQSHDVTILGVAAGSVTVRAAVDAHVFRRLAAGFGRGARGSGGDGRVADG